MLYMTPVKQTNKLNLKMKSKNDQENLILHPLHWTDGCHWAQTRSVNLFSGFGQVAFGPLNFPVKDKSKSIIYL